MKKDLHPKTNLIEIKCTSCAASYTVQSTKQSIKVDVCANCHPFYTGKMTGISKSGRAESFNKRHSRKTEEA